MSKWLPILIAIIIIGIVGTVSGYYLYQNSLQPNIQVTNTNIASPSTSYQSSTPLNSGRVSNSWSFNYQATLSGDYWLTFDNDFWIATKYINLDFTKASPIENYHTDVVVAGGHIWYEPLHLNEGQQVTGSFSIDGGSDEIEFRIEALTCTATVTFTCTLINAGSSDGFATVVFTVDGSSVWSNQYFLAKGGSQQISGSTTINNCDSHDFNLFVQSQYKP